MYAVSKFLRPPYPVTYYAWDWQDMVEGTSLQLNSTDGRRTLVYVAMHERKLALIEASVPEGRRSRDSFSSRLVGSTRRGIESATPRPSIRIRITVWVFTRDRHIG